MRERRNSDANDVTGEQAQQNGLPMSLRSPFSHVFCSCMGDLALSSTGDRRREHPFVRFDTKLLLSYAAWLRLCSSPGPPDRVTLTPSYNELAPGSCASRPKPRRYLSTSACDQCDLLVCPIVTGHGPRVAVLAARIRRHPGPPEPCLFDSSRPAVVAAVRSARDGLVAGFPTDMTDVHAPLRGQRRYRSSWTPTHRHATRLLSRPGTIESTPGTLHRSCSGKSQSIQSLAAGPFWYSNSMTVLLRRCVAVPAVNVPAS